MRITDGAVYIAGEVLQSSCAVCVPELAIAKDSTCMCMRTISSALCVFLFVLGLSAFLTRRAIAKDSTCMYMCTISSALCVCISLCARSVCVLGSCERLQKTVLTYMYMCIVSSSSSFSSSSSVCVYISFSAWSVQ